jgi:toxin secretion/phage lysis holin
VQLFLFLPLYKGGEWMDLKIAAGIGVCGSLLSWLFGGWDAALQTLLVFMAADYLTGLGAAGIFRKSPKSKGGGLSSEAGFQGLTRKCMMLVFVLLAHRLDEVLGTACIRDGVCAAFMANELLSIIENAGIMGVPVPDAVKNAIDLLKQKGEHDD